MANHKGSEGDVKVGTVSIGELRGWSMSVSANTIDDSVLTDLWATKQSGQLSWTGSAECFWDELDTTGQGALTIGAGITLNMYPEGATSGDVYFTGAAIVTSIERSGEIDGIVGVSFSFEGNGILTQSAVV